MRIEGSRLVDVALNQRTRAAARMADRCQPSHEWFCTDAQSNAGSFEAGGGILDR
jgi:hypothetical protein